MVKDREAWRDAESDMAKPLNNNKVHASLWNKLQINLKCRLNVSFQNDLLYIYNQQLTHPLVNTLYHILDASKPIQSKGAAFLEITTLEFILY